MSADPGAIFIRLSDVVGTDRDKPAIANFHLTVEFKKPFSLPTVLRAETAAAENEHHGMLTLQLGELPSFCRVVGKTLLPECLEDYVLDENPVRVIEAFIGDGRPSDRWPGKAISGPARAAVTVAVHQACRTRDCIPAAALK